MRARVWNAFLPIGSHLKGDKPPEADLVWLQSRGIEAEALTIIGLVRRKVLTQILYIRSLRRGFRGFSMLVHDRTSGVPCPAEDTTAYIHLRVQFYHDEDARKMFLEGQGWCYVKPVKPSESEQAVHQILDQQSKWYLNFVRMHKDLSDIELLKQLRQHLHYFANMSQMRIQ